MTQDETVRPVEYNCMTREQLEARGQTYHVKGEQHGISAFLRDGSRVLHGDSSYGRGPDILLDTHNVLDLTPFGRGEGWGGMPNPNVPLRRHDPYEDRVASMCPFCISTVVSSVPRRSRVCERRQRCTQRDAPAIIAG